VERFAKVACAFELIHAYSLVHDDVPCMDNDVERRGKPTVWKQFGEGTALLVGDALQALAFQLIATSNHDAQMRAELGAILSRASGWQGMVGGQFLDSCVDRSDDTEVFVRDMHSRKTGALIAASCEAGAVLAGVDDQARAVVREFGERLGMLFQATDDLLDSEGDITDADADRMLSDTLRALNGLMVSDEAKARLRDVSNFIRLRND
jgi:farnesyl diphosphate synthase